MIVLDRTRLTRPVNVLYKNAKNAKTKRLAFGKPLFIFRKVTIRYIKEVLCEALRLF